ncbi:MAG: DUF4422 domain-containing protein [Methanobrevibacter sp.]|nr:DUF4422 domain-containing protein [Methanobrevibacter sp.]
MKIYVVGSSKNKFLPLDNIRKKFFIDQKHEGDNIDFLNPWYCELTGLYYLWKHCDDDIVGLEHYRRYFVNDRNKLLSESEIRKLLETNDVIVCDKNRGIQNYPLKQALLERIKVNDLNSFMNNIDDFYKDCFNFYLEKSTYKCPYNMIICKKSVLDEWCKFIFSNVNILNEQKVFNDKNKRFAGFISEFLLYGFLLINKYRIVKCPIRFVK